jgi:hypothetical protein
MITFLGRSFLFERLAKQIRKLAILFNSIQIDIPTCHDIDMTVTLIILKSRSGFKQAIYTLSCLNKGTAMCLSVIPCYKPLGVHTLRNKIGKFLSTPKFQRRSLRQITGDDVNKETTKLTATMVSKAIVAMCFDTIFKTMCSNNDLGSHCYRQDGESTGAPSPGGQGTGQKAPVRPRADLDAEARKKSLAPDRGRTPVVQSVVRNNTD